MAHSSELDSLLWPTAQNQLLCCGPQSYVRFPAVAHRAASDSLLWPTEVENLMLLYLYKESTYPLDNPTPKSCEQYFLTICTSYHSSRNDATHSCTRIYLPICLTEDESGMLMSSVCIVILHWRKGEQWGGGCPKMGSRLWARDWQGWGSLSCTKSHNSK